MLGFGKKHDDPAFDKKEKKRYVVMTQARAALAEKVLDLGGDVEDLDAEVLRMLEELARARPKVTFMDQFPKSGDPMVLNRPRFRKVLKECFPSLRDSTAALFEKKLWRED